GGCGDDPSVRLLPGWPRRPGDPLLLRQARRNPAGGGGTAAPPITFPSWKFVGFWPTAQFLSMELFAAVHLKVPLQLFTPPPMTFRVCFASARPALAAVALAASLIAVPAAATPDARSAAEIDQLLSHVANSGCTFIRSGKEY